LKQFAPFGPGNMTPVFMADGITDCGQSKTVGQDHSHLRVVVEQGNSARFTGIGFGLGDKHDIACSGRPYKAAFSIDENEWQGRVSLQLKLRDIKG